MTETKLIYLDSAATSWPKPAVVADAVKRWIVDVGANPGRSAHRQAAESARVVYETRENLAMLLGAGQSRYVVFTANCTAALNMAIHGIVVPGSHVITTSMEHNSVIRPLRYLEGTRGVELTVVDADSEGRVLPEQIENAIQSKTSLVVINHGSNVVGTLQPLTGIKDAIGRIPLLVDAAQTAGGFPLNMELDGIDLLACAGHKGLLGPTGTGCLCVSPELAERMEPHFRGGTGSRSELEYQPDVYPDRFESGTLNVAGIAGLGAAVSYLLRQGVYQIRVKEVQLTQHLTDRLRRIKGVTVYGPEDAAECMPTVAFNIAGLTPAQVGYELDRTYNVACRVGLHCAPLAHKTLDTFPEGSVRFGLSAENTMEEIDQALLAVSKIASGA